MYENHKYLTTMLYTLPQLPYASESLAPVISKETVDFHYGKHEKTYIDNLNSLIKGTKLEDKPLEEIIKSTTGSLYNNAAQAWNHIFYFFSFSPDGRREPLGALRQAINTQYGSFESFKKQFEDVGVKIFGSGWVWLSSNDDGNLFITQGTNASNPLSEGLTPILTFDVWEHAYYLDYQNRRADALHALWDILDWEVIESRY